MRVKERLADQRADGSAGRHRPGLPGRRVTVALRSLLPLTECVTRTRQAHAGPTVPPHVPATPATALPPTGKQITAQARRFLAGPTTRKAAGIAGRPTGGRATEEMVRPGSPTPFAGFRRYQTSRCRFTRPGRSRRGTAAGLTRSNRRAAIPA